MNSYILFWEYFERNIALKEYIEPSIEYHFSLIYAILRKISSKNSLVNSEIYLVDSICDLHTGKLHSCIEEISTEIFVMC